MEKKQSTYHHFKMISENFRGSYCNGTDNKNYVKAFGCKDTNQIVVMILNQDENINYKFLLHLNKDSILAPYPLKINIDAGVDKGYSDIINNQSSVLLIFDLEGNIIKKMEYKVKDNKARPLLSEDTLIITEALSSAFLKNSFSEIKENTVLIDSIDLFKINIYPNPFKENFNIIVESPSQESIVLKIYDSNGKMSMDRLVLQRNQVTSFGNNLPAGIYKVEVSQGTKMKMFQIFKSP